MSHSLERNDFATSVCPPAYRKVPAEAGFRRLQSGFKDNGL